MTDAKQPAAGRNLDAKVAEYIIGWTNNWDNPGGTGDPSMWGIMDWRGPGDPVRVANFPCYSTDIRAAWTVVEKMKDFGFAAQIVTGIANGYDVVAMYNALGKHFVVDRESGSTSVPHAICLAALKAKGVL